MKIPNADYYVCATDKFLSGWGRAEGMSERVILPCHDIYEAMRVAEYAESRSDMKRVTICRTKPKLRRDVHYTLMDKNSAPAWYRYGTLSH